MEILKRLFRKIKQYYEQFMNWTHSLKLRPSLLFYLLISLIYILLLAMVAALIFSNGSGFAAMVIIVGSALILVRQMNLYYENKIMKPIALLKEASRKISDNNLDFTLSYPVKDEMGQLVDAFELMRQTVVSNNQRLWRGLEERKRINAAFAHDLRTPLTVLRGYVDYLKEFVPENKVSEEKIMETLDTMSTHINRLEVYTREMNALQKLQDIHVEKELTDLKALSEQMEEEGKILAEDTVHTFEFHQDLTKEHANMDTSLFMQVYNNLLNNAFRYAEDLVRVNLSSIGEYLYLTVEDDGEGFSLIDLHQATNAFYQNEFNEPSENEHFGLGLYICKIIVKNHGGEIKLDNNDQGGAVVTVSFFIG